MVRSPDSSGTSPKLIRADACDPSHRMTSASEVGGDSTGSPAREFRPRRVRQGLYVTIARDLLR